MKISLTLGPRQPLSRQAAWGCFTANVSAPGSGSLLAGRVTGYPQLLLYFAGFGATLIFAVRFFLWYFSNSARLQALQQIDPGQFFSQLWLGLRWALLGMASCAVAWIWSLASSLAILSQAREDERLQRLTKPAPPILKG